MKNFILEISCTDHKLGGLMPKNKFKMAKTEILMLEKRVSNKVVTQVMVSYSYINPNVKRYK